jgi:hypothetical protein
MACPSTLTMKALHSSEMLVEFSRTTSCHIPDGITPFNLSNYSL